MTVGETVGLPQSRPHWFCDPATCFSVLLSGTLRMSRTVRGDDVETVHTDQRGADCGTRWPEAICLRLPVWAGEAIDLIDDLPSTADLVGALAARAGRASARAGRR